MQQAEIGIIGGSGLYTMPGFSDVQQVSLDTPFGSPSDPYMLGTLEGRKVAFLSRHGNGHRFSPTEINYRANIHGMKQLGVERILSLSAVGSLKEEHHPLDFVDSRSVRRPHASSRGYLLRQWPGGARRSWTPGLW